MKKGRQDRIAETLTLEMKYVTMAIRISIKPSNSYALGR